LWGAIDHHGNVVITPSSGEPLIFAESRAEFVLNFEEGEEAPRSTAGASLGSPCRRTSCPLLLNTPLEVAASRRPIVRFWTTTRDIGQFWHLDWSVK
jgi:hypothetical protein